MMKVLGAESKCFAWVSFISSNVGPHVGLCVMFIHMFICAIITMVVDVCLMLTDVPVQVTHSFEVLVAVFVYAVQPDIFMGEFVLLQSTWKKECFPTGITHILMFFVDIGVFIKWCLGTESLMAEMAELYVMVRTVIFIEGFNSSTWVVTQFAVCRSELFVFLFQYIAFDAHLPLLLFHILCGNIVCIHIPNLKIQVGHS